MRRRAAGLRAGRLPAGRSSLGAALRRRFGRHQELVAVAGLQRQRRGDVGHRARRARVRSPRSRAEQLDARGAQRVGDRVVEPRDPVRVDVLDGGQLSFGERLAGGLLDRLEQVALPRGDEQIASPVRPARPVRPMRCT